MDDTVEINFDSVEVETDLAWLLDMGDAVIWLPKSGCEIDEQDRTVQVPVRLAVEKGLV